jgi:signal transduction histidine kinase
VTLSQRISLTLFLVILLTGVIFGFIIDRQITDLSEKEYQKFGQSLAQTISQSVLSYTIAGNKRKAQEILKRITKNNASITYIVIIGFNQEIFASASKGTSMKFDEADHAHLNANVGDHSFFDAETVNYDIAYMMIENLEAHIHLGLDGSRITQQIDEQRILVGELVLFLAIIGALIALYFGRSLSHPVRQLSTLLELFGKNQLQDIPSFKSTDPELHNLHKSFVAMVDERKASRELLIANQHELKELNAKLKQSMGAAESANKLKSEFLANMSHELRTPMHAILSFAEIGERKFDQVDRRRLQGYFQHIHESGKRLLNLLNDILDLSKLEAGHLNLNFQQHNLITVVDAVNAELNELMQKKSLSLEVEQTDVDTKAQFDQDKLMQVIRNIFSNAIKFSPEGKEIRVSFAQATLAAIEDKLADSSEISAISVSVTDQGVGIPEDELEHVFDKFVQSSTTKTASGGTGLGLPICKEIIAGHGGCIRAENNPAGGATFTFIIPYQADQGHG